MKTIRVAPPQSSALASQMPIWWLTSFLVAVGLNFVVERFLPGVATLAPWFGALPSPLRNVVLVFVLMLLGVVIQGTWWMMHRRGFGPA
jgi:hypothetical protein